MALTKIAELAARRQQARQAWRDKTNASVYITIGMGTCGLAAGANDALAAIEKELEARDLSAVINKVGCVGMCSYEPMVELQTSGQARINYGNATADNVGEIFHHYFEGQPLRRSEIVGQAVPTVTKKGDKQLHSLSFLDPETEEKIAFQRKQLRIVLSNCGLINPESIDDYLAVNGYEALETALGEMAPEEVIGEVLDSGLRGRGGGGFPTGLKWRFARQTQDWPKYIICNADEGDPGAFMDRSVLEGDPHSVVEGMIIAGYAMGAQHGYIYCRAEYPLAIHRLRVALEQARELNLLGENILGTDFSFDISIKEGAGAFVCGEETALMNSIQGERGQPRPRPPKPALSGRWEQPSNVNNVKSYAYTSRIIRMGADWFKSLGTEGSPGTAVFALTGMVNRTGLIEVPMGITLREIIYDIGGGISNGKKFKAVQTGGPLGGCLTNDYLDTAVDFDSLKAAGSVMGSGGMIVADESTCMVEFARYFMQFVCDESCGKCPPCRIGSTRMLEVLERITEGKGKPEDLDEIRRLAEGIKSGALCGLGQLAPSPVMSTLLHFEEEYRAHIDEKRCPSGVCQTLTRALCVNACPAGVDTPAYLALVSQGRYREGLEIHREANPFAMICGRVCPAFCESKCRRGLIDEPVSIRLVKRFMADQLYAQPWTPEPSAPPNGKKVAVVGAGPAGLTAALRLAQRGYTVTVFEKMLQPGGMMTYGIPAYRLPREPLFAEINHIRRAGVEIRCGKALGQDFDIDSLKADGYEAVVLALGAHKSQHMGIPGEDKSGVYPGVTFLRHIALSKSPDVGGQRVVVVGGGDVAIDSARSAWRLGASEVHVVYRREEKDMPAHREEIQAAQEEGIQFHFLVNPVAVLGDSTMTGVRLQRQALSEYDNSGRQRPRPIPGSEFDLQCDVLIPAIGQYTDLDWIEDKSIETQRLRTVKIGDAFETTCEGIFAAGDCVSGPATVVQAVAQGNQVAAAVDNWLVTGKLQRLAYHPKRHDVPALVNVEDYAEVHRAAPELLPTKSRRGAFLEVEVGFSAQAAQEEAKRCLRCDLEWLERIGAPIPEIELEGDTNG
jgi:NADH-quinone oxidoreductase subunit F